LTTFLLGRELWGRRVAWMAAVALACSHYHVHFSRVGSNQILDGLVVTLALWLLVRGLRLRQVIYFALAGMAIALGWYGYFGARLVVIIAICYLLWRSLVERRFLHRYGRSLVAALAAALVFIAPLILHYLARPHGLMSRPRQISIFSSGWLERAQDITGLGAGSLLLQQFWKSISAFNYTTDTSFWYLPSIPLLDSVSGVLFVLGLLWATVCCRRPGNGLLLMWFWLGLSLGWVMTIGPPASQRMTILAPALALLVALGLEWLITAAQRVPGPRWGLLAPVLLIVMGVLNLRYYFLVYTPTRVFGNPTAEVATDLSRYLVKRSDDYVVHFHGPPSIYWEFGTLAFMAPDVEGVDVPPLGEGEWPEPDLNQGVRFVILPQRLGDLDTIRERYPSGQETSFYSGHDDRLLYVLYEVDK